jgi:hypothetical protein
MVTLGKQDWTTLILLKSSSLFIYGIFLIILKLNYNDDALATLILAISSVSLFTAVAQTGLAQRIQYKIANQKFIVVRIRYVALQLAITMGVFFASAGTFTFGGELLLLSFVAFTATIVSLGSAVLNGCRSYTYSLGSALVGQLWQMIVLVLISSTTASEVTVSNILLFWLLNNLLVIALQSTLIRFEAQVTFSFCKGRSLFRYLSHAFFLVMAFGVVDLARFIERLAAFKLLETQSFIDYAYVSLIISSLYAATVRIRNSVTLNEFQNWSQSDFLNYNRSIKLNYLALAVISLPVILIMRKLEIFTITYLELSAATLCLLGASLFFSLSIPHVFRDTLSTLEGFDRKRIWIRFVFIVSAFVGIYFTGPNSILLFSLLGMGIYLFSYLLSSHVWG